MRADIVVGFEVGIEEGFEADGEIKFGIFNNCVGTKVG